MRYLCANFIFPTALFSIWARCVRQTDVRRLTDVRRVTDVMSSLLNRVRKYVIRFHENSTSRKFMKMAVICAVSEMESYVIRNNKSSRKSENVVANSRA